MPPNEEKAPPSQAAHDPEVQLRPKKRSTKYMPPAKFLFLIALMGGAFAFLFWLLYIDNPDEARQPTTQPTTIQETPTPIATSSPDQSDVVAPPEPDAEGSSDEGPLSGTWTMWWRNAENSDNVAFTLRFNGLNTGTVEVLNDENEFDTSFTFEDDGLSFGFTRMFEPPPNWPEDNPFGGWPEKSTFEGTRVSDGQFLGKWFRDDWECRPERQPPCVTKPEPNVYTSWLEREP
jgi:hypothetical protein